VSTIPVDIRETDDPGALLFGRTRGRVLGWLLGHPDESFYLREIVRNTGSAQGAVQRELHLLTRAGLLRRTVTGRQVYFQAERESPIFPELQQLLLKTAGTADALRESFVPLADRLDIVLIFGSAARGQLQRESDIDLLVVGEVAFADVVGAVGIAQKRLGRDVNPTVYRPTEFRRKLAERHHFLTSVLAEPHVFVIGRRDVLDRLANERLADSASDQPARSSRLAGGGRARSDGKRQGRSGR
jgi:predicted nucleotidyltransferase